MGREVCLGCCFLSQWTDPRQCPLAGTSQAMEPERVAGGCAQRAAGDPGEIQHWVMLSYCLAGAELRDRAAAGNDSPSVASELATLLSSGH